MAKEPKVTSDAQKLTALKIIGPESSKKKPTKKTDLLGLN